MQLCANAPLSPLVFPSRLRFHPSGYRVSRKFASLQERPGHIPFFRREALPRTQLQEELSRVPRHRRTRRRAVFVVQVQLSKNHSSCSSFSALSIILDFPCQDPPHAHHLVSRRSQVLRKGLKTFCPDLIFYFFVFCFPEQFLFVSVQPFLADFNGLPSQLANVAFNIPNHVFFSAVRAGDLDAQLNCTHLDCKKQFLDAHSSFLLPWPQNASEVSWQVLCGLWLHVGLPFSPV